MLLFIDSNVIVSWKEYLSCCVIGYICVGTMGADKVLNVTCIHVHVLSNVPIIRFYCEESYGMDVPKQVYMFVVISLPCLLLCRDRQMVRLLTLDAHARGLQ